MNVEFLGSQIVLSERLSSLMAVSAACAKSLQNMWAGPYWEGVLPFLDPWVCA